MPVLILLASALLALQEPIRAWLLLRVGRGGHASHEGLAIVPVFAAAVYGGYFGAGLSVIVLAALGLLLEDSLTRLNAAKQAIGFAANISAAVRFLLSGVRPATLRVVVVTVGTLVGLAYLVRG